MNHISVMPEEVIENLLHNKDGDYLDCTFGMGGHSKAILKNLSERGSLKAIDKDPKVFEFSKKICLECYLASVVPKLKTDKRSDLFLLTPKIIRQIKYFCQYFSIIFIKYDISSSHYFF